MPETSQILNIVVFLLFLGGILDAFRIYFRVFKRNGGSENLMFNHLAATLFGFFRFVPYFLLAAIVLAVAGRF